MLQSVRCMTRAPALRLAFRRSMCTANVSQAAVASEGAAALPKVVEVNVGGTRCVLNVLKPSVVPFDPLRGF